MKTVTIVLADDHNIVRQGFRSLLENQEGFSVIAEASDGLEAVKLTCSLRPDVLVTDLMMPCLNGLEVTRRISRMSPTTRVIVLSMYMDEPYVIEALQNGAWGYVLKESNISDLIKAIREVADGRHYLGSPLSDFAIAAYKEKTKGVSLDPYNTLTAREREVLQLVAEGYTNADIAGKLFISQRTVESHRANLMQKLAFTSRADLIVYAVAKGLRKR
jgi:two-component system, NarL family, response regulator NreC